MPGGAMGGGGHGKPLGPKGALALAACFACTFFIVGIIFVIAANDSYGHWETIDAKIVNTTFCEGIDIKRYPEGQYNVTYSFTTKDGQSVLATTDECKTYPPPLGATETIRYDPSSPSVGVIEDKEYYKFHYGGLVLMVLGFVGVGVFGHMLYKKMKSSPSNDADYGA